MVLFAAGALVMALRVQSVQALWFFTSDLVFVLLFPQLVYAIFDSKSNRIGSMVAFFLSLALRLGGGEPLLGLKPFIHYPEIFAAFLPGTAAGLVRSGDGRGVVPVQDASRRGGIRNAAAGIALDGAVETGAVAGESGARGIAGGGRAKIRMNRCWRRGRCMLSRRWGLVAAAGIAALVVEGGDAAFTRAFELMILATAIDALDGPLAR